MEFFAKANERLYPVGRLDYLSEGLLLMSNDGELANKLTSAASQVEKTYLVKIAGNPTEEELEKLRRGVSIPKSREGTERVRTSPAGVRQIREGENPWFEVVLIEGRNRELRKLFEQIGHFVEKIRRVGYGPLTLDVEPGIFRELEKEELDALRLAADGKLKMRRPNFATLLPKEAGKTVVPDDKRPAGKRPGRLQQTRRLRQTRRIQQARLQTTRRELELPSAARSGRAATTVCTAGGRRGPALPAAIASGQRQRSWQTATTVRRR
jgi:23S rRNA pseudouridine2605 synthase